jgi:hypothetical protein
MYTLVLEYIYKNTIQITNIPGFQDFKACMEAGEKLKINLVNICGERIPVNYDCVKLLSSR